MSYGFTGTAVKKKKAIVLEDKCKCCHEVFMDAIHSEIDESADTLEGRLRKEIIYLKLLLKEKNQIITDKCTIIRDKEAIIELLQNIQNINLKQGSGIEEKLNKPATSQPTANDSKKVTRKAATADDNAAPISEQKKNQNKQSDGTDKEFAGINDKNKWSVVKRKKSGKRKQTGIVGTNTWSRHLVPQRLISKTTEFRIYRMCRKTV